MKPMLMFRQDERQKLISLFDEALIKTRDTVRRECIEKNLGCSEAFAMLVLQENLYAPIYYIFHLFWIHNDKIPLEEIVNLVSNIFKNKIDASDLVAEYYKKFRETEHNNNLAMESIRAIYDKTNLDDYFGTM